MDGGPFEYSPEHNDDGANFQQAMFHIDAQSQSYHATALFWYVAHFSKFVRPESIRIDVTLEGDARFQPDPMAPEGTTGIELIAFETSNEDKIVCQILNHRNKSTNITLQYFDLEAELNLPAMSITTAMWLVVE